MRNAVWQLSWQCSQSYHVNSRYTLLGIGPQFGGEWVEGLKGGGGGGGGGAHWALEHCYATLRPKWVISELNGPHNYSI